MFPGPSPSCIINTRVCLHLRSACKQHSCCVGREEMKVLCFCRFQGTLPISLSLLAVAADQAREGVTEERVSPPSGGSTPSVSSGDITLLKNDPPKKCFFPLFPLKVSKLPSAPRPPQWRPSQWRRDSTGGKLPHFDIFFFF